MNEKASGGWVVGSAREESNSSVRVIYTVEELEELAGVLSELKTAMTSIAALCCCCQRGHE